VPARSPAASPLETPTRGAKSPAGRPLRRQVSSSKSRCSAVNACGAESVLRTSRRPRALLARGGTRAGGSSKAGASASSLSPAAAPSGGESLAASPTVGVTGAGPSGPLEPLARSGSLVLRPCAPALSGQGGSKSAAGSLLAGSSYGPSSRNLSSILPPSRRVPRRSGRSISSTYFSRFPHKNFGGDYNPRC
jgi:hypothetical protein